MTNRASRTSRSVVAAALGCATALALAGCRAPADDEVRRADDEVRRAAAEEERLAQLAALGYTGFVRRPDDASRRGVVAIDRRRAAPGVTFVGSRSGSPIAYAFDLEGNEVWRIAPQPTTGDSLLWMEPTADGQLLISGRRYLMKTTWAGETIWQAPKEIYHHGFSQGDDGTIYAMSHRRRTLRRGERTVAILDGTIVVLSPAGELLRQISLLDLLGPEVIPPAFIERAAGGDRMSAEELEEVLKIEDPADVFHLNSVAALPRDIGVARAGDLVVCLRSLDLVLALSPDPVELRWLWRQGRRELDRPHAPWPLANGNLLVFDNGWGRDFSRVVEVDPRQGEIVWQFVAEPPEAFYTRRGGFAQPLTNGNLLISVTESGRLVEITRDGEIVWDFWHPVFGPPKRGREPQRRTIYRAWRWSAEELAAFGAPAPLRLAALGAAPAAP